MSQLRKTREISLRMLRIGKRNGEIRNIRKWIVFILKSFNSGIQTKNTLFCSILILFIIFNLILIIFKENKSESRKNNFLILLLLNIFRRIQKTISHTDLSVTVTLLPPPYTLTVNWTWLGKIVGSRCVIPTSGFTTSPGATAHRLYLSWAPDT